MNQKSALLASRSSVSKRRDYLPFSMLITGRARLHAKTVAPRLLRPGHVAPATTHATPFSDEVAAQSRFFIRTLQRQQFEPKGVEESLIHPPPFSRAFLLIFGSFLGLSVGAAYVTDAPMLVDRAARYQLLISTLAVPFFASVDKTFCIQSSKFSHRFRPMLAVHCAYAAQVVGATFLCAEFCVDGPGKWQTWPLLGLWGVHSLSLLYLRNTLPTWLMVWRGIAGVAILGSAVAMHQRMWVFEKKDEITLKNYKRGH